MRDCCKAPKKMATPYVPVPMPIGNSSSSFTTNRNQRSSSFGSISTNSNSSKGQLEDSNIGNLKQAIVPDQMDSSPLIRTKFTNANSSIEYSTRPRESEEQNSETVNLEDRPSTPTILGYEVMEERAKFTVSIDFCCAPLESERLTQLCSTPVLNGLMLACTCNFLKIEFKWFLHSKFCHCSKLLFYVNELSQTRHT